MQKLFSTNRGSTILPVISDSGFGPVYWVGSSTSSSPQTYYLKLANYGSSSQVVNVKIPGANVCGNAVLQTLSGDPMQSNYPLDVTVTPQMSTVTGSVDGGYSFSIPAWGVGVLTVT